MKKPSRKRKAIALYQIVLLMSLSFAIASILSNHVGFVSAQEKNDDTGEKILIGTAGVGGTIAISSGVAAVSGATASIASGAAAVGAHAAVGALATGGSATTAAAATSYSYVIASGGTVAQATAAAEAAAVAAGATPAAATFIATETASLASEIGPEAIIAGGKEAAKAAGVKLGGGKGVGAAIKGAFTGSGGNALVTGFIHAGIWAATAFLISKIFGFDSKIRDKFVAAAGVGGFLSGSLLATTTLTGLQTFGVGLLATAVVFAVTYKKEKQRTVEFQCAPWEAPLKGENCGACNTDPDRPCTEYRCKSLGQSCSLINQGTSNEACVWVNRDDINAPIITPAPNLLNPDELSYTNHNTRPPSLGVKVIDSRTSAGCLQAWTRLEFGLNTDEPAKCSWSINHTESIDQMIPGFLEGSAKTLNHSLRFVIPNNQSGADLSPVLQSDGTFTYFVRCIDENGNSNVDEFAVSFCIDESPDTTPPRVVDTLIKSESFVAFDATEVPFEIYTDEPAECKWSRNDQDFDNMENSMACDTDPANINNLQYTCSGTLTGLQNGVDNSYYFRCKDLSGNEMSQSYLSPDGFVLKGSQPLNILSAGPNGTITGRSTSVLVDLTVETDDGAEQGKAVCDYRSPDSGVPIFTPMFETNNFKHTQPNLGLSAGTHEFEFKCVDAGGNIAEESTVFTVEVDQNAPDVTRAYKQGDFLKIITNENAECVYNTQSCNYEFGDGLPMSHSTPDDLNTQIVQWKTGANFYIKCQDELLNRPSPNKCSIIVKTVS